MEDGVRRLDMIVSPTQLTDRTPVSSLDGDLRRLEVVVTSLTVDPGPGLWGICSVRRGTNLVRLS